MLASPYSPERYTQSAIFSRFNMPTECSKNFTENPKINAECTVNGNQATLTLMAEKHIDYQIYKDSVLYRQIKNKQDKLTIKLPVSDKETTLKIIANYQGKNDQNIEKSFKLIKTNSTNTEIEHKKWYI